MITCIREVRRAQRLTLQDVADRCHPPTTAQTIGRLETGTRTVSVAWLNRIAAALGVAASDLVTLPSRPDLPVIATLGPDGATAPRHAATLLAPQPGPGQVAILVTAGVGDYRAGDQIWCDRLAPEDFATALNRDILLPGPAGRVEFGRLLAFETARLQFLPHRPGAGIKDIPPPPWLARAVRLLREV